jgi:hypothetical protein
MMIDREERDGDNDVGTEKPGRGITDIIINATVGLPLGAVYDRLIAGDGGLHLLPKYMQISGYGGGH